MDSTINSFSKSLRAKRCRPIIGDQLRIFKKKIEMGVVQGQRRWCYDDSQGLIWAAAITVRWTSKPCSKGVGSFTGSSLVSGPELTMASKRCMSWKLARSSRLPETLSYRFHSRHHLHKEKGYQHHRSLRHPSQQILASTLN